MIDLMKLSSFPSRLKSAMTSQVTTVSFRQVAPIFREPFIYTGYRLPHQPWSYYWKSLFQLHNETANVWLHIIASGIVFRGIWGYFYTYDVLHDKYGWSLVGFALGAFFGALLSSVAHHFHSKSIWWHYVLFMMDYGGVTLYTFGTGLGCMYICSEKDMYKTMEPFFLPLNVFLSVFTFYMFCRAKLKSSSQGRRRMILVCTMLFYAAIISVPVLARYAKCLSQPECSLSSLNHLSWCFALLALSAFFFASHVPERIFPGKFDLGGNGHSMFHLVSLWTIHKQLDGVKVDISAGAAAHTEPSLVNFLAAYVIVISAQILTLFYLREDINERVKKDTIVWKELRSRSSS